jgi:hypothetical protein
VPKVEEKNKTEKIIIPTAMRATSVGFLDGDFSYAYYYY